MAKKAIKIIYPVTTGPNSGIRYEVDPEGKRIHILDEADATNLILGGFAEEVRLPEPVLAAAGTSTVVPTDAEGKEATSPIKPTKQEGGEIHNGVFVGAEALRGGKVE